MRRRTTAAAVAAVLSPGLPADSTIRVGLVSHGGAGATADFDDFRLYR